MTWAKTEDWKYETRTHSVLLDPKTPRRRDTMFPKADNVKTLEASCSHSPSAFLTWQRPLFWFLAQANLPILEFRLYTTPLHSLPSALAAFLQHVILGDPSVLQHVPTRPQFSALLLISDPVFDSIGVYSFFWTSRWFLCFDCGENAMAAPASF